MEVKSFMAFFVICLAFTSFDSSYATSENRLATISGCIYELVVQDIPKVCEEAKSESYVRSQWLATKDYLACQEETDTARRKPWRAHHDIITGIQGMCNKKHSILSDKLSTGEDKLLYAAKWKSLRGKRRFVRGIIQMLQSVETEIETELYGGAIPSAIDEKAWRDGLSRRIQHAEFAIEEFKKKNHTLIPKKFMLDTETQENFSKLQIKAHYWLDDSFTSARATHRQVQEILLKDISVIKDRNDKVLGRLENIYADKYLREIIRNVASGDSDTWIGFSKHIGRIVAFPLEFQDILEDIIKYIQIENVDIQVKIQRYPIWRVFSMIICFGVMLIANPAALILVVIYICVATSFSVTVQFYHNVFLYVAITIVQLIIQSMVDVLFGTKKLSKRNLVEEERPEQCGTVYTFFSY